MIYIQRKLFTISNNYNNVSLNFKNITKQETIVYRYTHHNNTYNVVLSYIRYIHSGKEGDLQLFSVYNYSILYHIHTLSFRHILAL